MDSVLSPGPFGLQATCSLVCVGLGGRRLVGVLSPLAACGGPWWLLFLGHRAADSLLGGFLRKCATRHLLWDLSQHLLLP